MDKIIIGFSRPTKWKPFAWAIMKICNTPYDHVYIRLYSETYERNIIYQASKMIINFMGTEVFGSENIIIKEFEVLISDENKKALMQFAIDNAGKPYSWKEIVGLAWVKLCGFFGRKTENPFKEGTKEYVCSILACYILENFANEDVPGDFQNADPKTLFDYLSKLPSTPDSGSGDEDT